MATRKCSITNVTWAGFPLSHTELGRLMASTPSFGFLHAPERSPHKVCSTGQGTGATFSPQDSQLPGEHTASSGLRPHSPPLPGLFLLTCPGPATRPIESFSIVFHHCYPTANPLPAPCVSSTIKRYTTQPCTHPNLLFGWKASALQGFASPVMHQGRETECSCPDTKDR